MAFTVPALPYAFEALEPHIDAKTMEIHHDKHHAAYVAKLNAAVVSQPALGSESVEEILKKLDKVAYVRFASVYLDFKDVKEFMNELRDLVKAKEAVDVRAKKIGQ